MEGMIHSIETFGTVDGPGIRYVVFVKGCPMRCQYCHNPDTWEMAGGTKMSTDEILDDYERYKPFLKGGGLTVTGGEPLVQIDFLTELFEKAKQRGIHTCLDTSGIMFRRNEPEIYEKYVRLIKSTDLIMLDIKHIDPEEHRKLTSQPCDNIFDFLKFLDEQEKEIWIRHVLVPGITLIPEYLKRLGEFIAQFRHVKALDVLPYHSMGKEKYQKMGIDYVLKDVEEATKDQAIEARKIIIDAMREKRRSMESE
ncbi:MAG: pyruvate formate-lyase-activating protein [Clostridium sp.]|nr:pyruvate formate-lyase-activating protein [Clostridium sp.]MCM1398604.1 pyruvate formate-lyase-activating protein [Clostridium sp.]MCM1459892.1 pyruvate formate-lyase-activating protein [Bacteroides sp.]